MSIRAMTSRFMALLAFFTRSGVGDARLAAGHATFEADGRIIELKG